jgi:hypothetical protein
LTDPAPFPAFDEDRVRPALLRAVLLERDVGFFEDEDPFRRDALCFVWATLPSLVGFLSQVFDYPRMAGAIGPWQWWAHGSGSPGAQARAKEGAASVAVSDRHDSARADLEIDARFSARRLRQEKRPAVGIETGAT